MGVVRRTSAASSSRHADVDNYPYTGRPGTGRQLQPKHTGPGYGIYQTFGQLTSPGAQATSPVLYHPNALSPGAASWVSIDSSETGTSHHLARKRGLSAVCYTPTSSTHASPGAFPDISSHSRQTWSNPQHYSNYYQHDPPSDPSLSPPADLRGLGLPLQEEPFAEHQAYPFHNAGALTYPTTPSPQPTRQRTGVRCGPLSVNARENAGAVRESGGSCIRCFTMREKCDAGTPCGRCKIIVRTARSWKMPCSRQWLNERSEYFLPRILTSSLELENVNDFINSKTFFAYEGSQLTVPLTIGFGQPLVLDAVEVDLVGRDILSKQGFAPALGVFEMCSPAIVPCWPVDMDAILARVRSWMSEVLTTGGSEYPEILFPTPDHPERNRHILALIHDYWETANIPKDENCVLTTALRLSVALYVMGHALIVPPSSINAFFSQLQHRDYPIPDQPPTPSLDSDSGSDDDTEDDTVYVSPRAVVKVVKSIILRLTRHLTTCTFKLLHDQLGPKRHPNSTFESAFSASFLILTSLAQIQISLYERAIAGSRQPTPDLRFSMNDAKIEIQRLEDEVGQYVVGLFLHRYKPKKQSSKTTNRNTATRARSPNSGSPNSANSSESPPFLTFTQTHNTNTNADPNLQSPSPPPPSSALPQPFRTRLLSILHSEKQAIRNAAREIALKPSTNTNNTNPALVLTEEVMQDLFSCSGEKNITRMLARLCETLIGDHD